jgi:predicted N-formylglutamate amidohydrolase
VLGEAPTVALAGIILCSHHLLMRPFSTDHSNLSVSEAFEVIEAASESAVLLLADHATNIIPPEYDALGLPEAQLQRHIAYDIGIGPLTRMMAHELRACAILTRFSRLLIDPNRGADDPTLVMRTADRAFVPGNARIGAEEIKRRRERFHKPYHDAIAARLDAMLARGLVPIIVSLHSYTPVMKGIARPWHAGVLWDADPRLALPLIEALAREPDLMIGDNEPYDGALAGDTIDQHATMRGLPNALIEVRQDLIADEDGVALWAEKLTRLLKPIIAEPDMRLIRHYGSRTRDRIRHGR